MQQQPPPLQQGQPPTPGAPAMINLGNFNQDANATEDPNSPSAKMRRTSQDGGATAEHNNGNAQMSEEEQKVQSEFQKGVYAVFVAVPGTAMDGTVLGVPQKYSQHEFKAGRAKTNEMVRNYFERIISIHFISNVNVISM